MSVRCVCVVLLFAGSLALLAGCEKPPRGGPRLDAFPVDGEVYVDGQPAENALVVLKPETPLDLPEGAQPIGSTGLSDASGKFKISTYADADGAPAGKYGVSVTWPEATRESKSPLDGPDRLGGRYEDPSEGGLPQVEVVDGPVTIPRLELTTK